MTYTLSDLFCGAGGSALGATAVPGVELRYAANHWPLAVETHAAAFPHADHDVADISQVDPRRVPRTDILWASPECTNHSIAKGRRRADAQPDLFGETLPDAAAERSRATMWDVPRFAEHHRYRAIVVENVVDAARWVQWPAWLMAMELLGYRAQCVWLNSMHAPALATPRAPQSRDRLYVVFTPRTAPAPRLDVRPRAWCDACGVEVAAVQSWKRPDRPAWGRYRAQYLYRCPHTACRNAVVEPYTDPAAAAIDWTRPGQRIGDRAKPLSDKTMARIRAGLARYGCPLTFEARGNTYVRIGADGRPVYARAWPIHQPTATLTTTETRALLVPSGGTWNETAHPVGEPMRARTTRETDALVVPGLVVPVEGRDGKHAAPVGVPLRTQTARLESALVVPYYGTGVARPVARELPTMGTVDTAGVAFIAELRGGHSDTRPVAAPLATVTASGNHHGLVRHHQAATAPDVDDCTFRMLDPDEVQAAMAFPAAYRVLGTRRERVRQLGNGVTPPAAEFLLRAVVASFGDTAADVCGEAA